MFADDHCARVFVSEKSENLRGLAIKALAKYYIRRDWFPPPIAFDVPIFSNVAHGIADSVILSEAKNLDQLLCKQRLSRDVSLYST
jgi:hypothetical protein